MPAAGRFSRRKRLERDIPLGAVIGIPARQYSLPRPSSDTGRRPSAFRRRMVSTRTQSLAQPDDMATAGLQAWYMDASQADQREPHRDTQADPVSLSQLADLGVLYWKLDPSKYEKDSRLQAIRDARGYSYQDIITVSPDKLPGYEQKLKSFFEEHLHTDEEVRYILEGSGYFDVRDVNERWIRIECKPGDLITLPEGIYHRFTLDSTNYIKAMRLFVGEPVWTPVNRPADDHASRQKYVAAHPEIAAH